MQRHPGALPVAARHVAGDNIQILRQPGRRIGELGQLHFVKLAAGHQHEGVAARQLHQITGFQQRDCLAGHAILRRRGEMHRRVRLGGVGRARDQHQHVDLDLAQPLGQQFGGVQIGHPQHDDGVADVADDLAGAVAVAEAGGDVRQGLGVEREAQPAPRPLLSACTISGPRTSSATSSKCRQVSGQRFRHRQALAQAVLVEFAGVGHQIAHHALPHRGGDFRVGQGIEAAVDHRPLADRTRPVQDRARDRPDRRSRD